MIQVTWQRRGGQLSGFRVSGHAGFAHHGQDIVCAAVSALAQTAVLALERLADTEVAVELREGYLQCQVIGLTQPGTPAWVILESMRLGLEEIAQNYAEHVTIEVQEV